MPAESLQNDPQFVTEQYRTGEKLDARIRLHRRFSTNPYGWCRWVFDRLDLPPRCSLLELGGGPGGLWAENRERIPDGWSVTLTDLHAGMVGRARAVLGARARYAVLDAQSIPFPAESFDAVLANHMLYHVPDLPKALAEIRRVLRAGGWLYATTVGRSHVRELAGLIDGFDSDPAAWGWHAPGPFTLEDGAEQLARVFDGVSLQRYGDSLEVTEAGPLAEYMLSGRSGADEEFRGRFTRFVRRELDARGGVFHVTKDSGIFTAIRKTNYRAEKSEQG